MDTAAGTLERPPLGREAIRWALGVGVVLLLELLAHSADISVGALWTREGWSEATRLLEGLSTPDLSGGFLIRVGRLAVESLLIGVAGTGLALALGIPLALVCAGDLSLPDDRARFAWRGRLTYALRWAARGVLAVLRGIPELVWAFMFVRMLGLGPAPAVLAIGLTFGGIIGKLFAELLEAVDRRPVRLLRAAGVGSLGTLIFGALPQVRRQWVAYGAFRLECAVRSATVLGVVGAGGLGQEIALSVRYFQYDKLSTSLLAVLAVVVGLEFASSRLREVRRGLGVGVAVGTVACMVVLHRDWAALLSPTRWITAIGFVTGSLGQPLSPDIWSTAWAGAWETLVITSLGTVLGGLGAALVAPLATRALVVGSYLPDPPAESPAARWLGWVLFGSARLGLQIFRALPELVWALLFVVWVGPGPLAGALAIGAHTVGILGRLFGEALAEVEPEPAAVLEGAGHGPLGVFLFGVLPAAAPRALAYGAFRFEVNLRATAVVGFVGAGGLGNAIHTAISLFHFADLGVLIAVLLITVVAVDTLGDQVRRRLLMS